MVDNLLKMYRMRCKEHLTIADCIAALHGQRPKLAALRLQGRAPLICSRIVEANSAVRLPIPFRPSQGVDLIPNRLNPEYLVATSQDRRTAGVVLLVIRAADGQLFCGLIPKAQEHNGPFSPLSPVKSRC